MPPRPPLPAHPPPGPAEEDGTRLYVSCLSYYEDL